MKQLLRGRHARLLAPALAIMVAGSCAGPRVRTERMDRSPPDESWRATRPAPGPVPEFKLPRFDRAELKNGLTVVVVEEHSLPMITAAIVVRGGSAHEGREAGLAALTWDLLDEGAGSLNNLALANAFAALGSEVKTEAGREMGAVKVELLKRHADAGLELLSSLVKRPTFANRDFERVRDRRVDELKEREGEPAEIADALAESLAFGVEHPYGHDEDGTVASLSRLTAGKARGFWGAIAGPKNAALVLVGDVTLDEAKALADKHLGKWSGAARAPATPNDPRTRSALTLAMVDVPGAPRSAIRVMRPVMARGDADEPALLVMNEILGGSYASRLNAKLRDEKKWTESAVTIAERRAGKGPVTVVTDVQTPNTAEALAEVLAQLEAVKANVTDDELARAKAGWVRSLPAVLGLPDAQVRAAGTLFAYGLPADHFATLATAVTGVTAEAVKKVATRAFPKDDLVVVIVGDRAAVEPGLRERELGPVVAFDKDGTPAR